ncbi:MAG: sulfotransferase family protein [Hyphomicrobiales bacterium]|nr:sulfotransferase family protein [Hyphomicrobiales bacterium]
MILSHDLKCIFIKTRKVGGTSFEIALSKFCGANDIITPIAVKDEQIRTELGFRTAQNYINPDWARFAGAEDDIGGQTLQEYFNHITAADVKARIPAAIWDDYLIVSMVRSPYDRIISSFFWHGGKPRRGAFERFVVKNQHLLSQNQVITHIDGVCAVDYFLRFESLQDDVAVLEEKLNITGLWEQFNSINAKGGTRPKEGADVLAVFANAPRARQLVAQHCAGDIERFGYALPDNSKANNTGVVRRLGTRLFGRL